MEQAKDRVERNLTELKAESARLIDFLSNNISHPQYYLLYDQLCTMGRYITILKLRLASWVD